MRSQRSFLILLLLALLSNFVIAQRGGGGGGGNNNDEEEESPSPAPAPTKASPTKSTPTVTAPRVTIPPPKATPEEKPEEEEKPTPVAPKPTPTPEEPEEEETDEEDKPVDRGKPPTSSRVTNSISDSGDKDTKTNSAPTRTITNTGGADDDGDIAPPTNAPKINIIPNYVVRIPETKNAPFMQKQSVPEGTIFIAVGSLIAAASLIVFVWRAVIAWTVHRSVSRNNKGGLPMDSKSALGKPPASRGGMYSAHAGSTVSLNPLAGRKMSTANGPPGGAGRNITPNASLFFSPTAAAGGASQPGDRRSAFLPAGYYPTAAPQNPSQTHFPSHSISSSHFGRPGLGPSPPGSPMLGPGQAPPSRGTSSIYNLGGQGGLRVTESYASLTLPPTGRAPSAYLEDLFEDHTPQQGGRK